MHVYICYNVYITIFVCRSVKKLMATHMQYYFDNAMYSDALRGKLMRLLPRNRNYVTSCMYRYDVARTN
jgi:hypothetical protein